MNAHPAITPKLLIWSVLGLGLALAPHAGRFNVGMLACFGALALWRILGAYGHLPLPTRAHPLLWILKQVLALTAFLAIYISYRGHIGRDAGVALLSALLGLKVLELEHERDFYVVNFLSYFLVVTNFFYTQSIVTALYMLAVVVVITAGLVRFNNPVAEYQDFACVRLAMTMVAQALPLMAVAFLLFPRLPGPLWGLPQDAFSAVTGLSDHMTIGQITSLGTSDEVAFRVKFDGQIPAASERYWRGPVLWESDGRTWRTGEIGLGLPHAVIKRGPEYQYSVLLEPTGEHWLLGLDAVTQAGRTARVHADQSLRSKQPIKRRLSYKLQSATHYSLLELTAAERAAALELPAHRHPKALALARTWAAQDPDPGAIVDRALNYFKQQGFVYTLLPPPLPHDSVDQFLFETHAGFCEHFAATFTILMRAAGVPARVVTGYQGGEFNEVSDYLIIRQRDAHAWAEVYMPQRGWIRVDPTAAVAPSRLSLGIESFADRSPLAILDRDGAAFKAWRSAAAWWDAVNFEWAQWVLGYSPQRQQDLFAGLGWDVDPGDLMFGFTLAVASIVGILALMTLHHREPQDPVTRAYAQFCRKLARVELPRAPFEGPLSYARRVTAARPDLQPEVDYISQLYAALRYADLRIDRALLLRKVRSFSPRQPKT